MPTLSQLPLALTTNPTDQVLLQQGTATLAVTLATMLAHTQSSLTLASGSLLGRVSAMSGSPEPVLVGAGLAVENGALTLAPVSVTGDVAGGGVGTLDLSLRTITTPGTYSKVTVNSKGLITNGTTLAANDVVAALGYVPYSNANPSAFVSPTALSTFAPLVSPALSGTPTAPTPSEGDDSNALATTAFVKSYAYSSGNPSGFTSPAGLSTFPVMNYGAFFDGIHDDQPAIMAAIAAAAAVGGGTVLLPAGRASGQSRSICSWCCAN